MNNKEFTEKYYIDRTKNLSVKWQRGKKMNCLPMWIADMDFKMDQRLIDALNDFIAKGDFGYMNLPQDYYDVFTGWHQKRHNVQYKQEWIRFSRGAIDAIHQVVNALSNEKDGILITTPLYPPFASTIKNSGRRLYESKMIDNDGFFTFDYKDIEKKFKTGRIKMFMLCSPHNPLGRVFKKGELEELFELCRKYNVLICADEVHCDLIMPDQEFLPAYSFSKYRNRMVTITAAAKTFSLALFSHCHIIIADPKLRKRFIAYQQKTHKGSINVFNALPTYYSYQFGEEWLDAFNNVVFENYSYIRKELGKDLEICTLEGSYLLFINLEGYCQGKTAFDTLVKDCSIVANAGETFAKGYESWARLNLATSLKNIRKAVRNIKKLIKEKQQ